MIEAQEQSDWENENPPGSHRGDDDIQIANYPEDLKNWIKGFKDNDNKNG